jgi:transaldolase
MELYLDSADLKEIEEAFKLGYLTGLTTTPTFMHREGITNIDDTILKLSKMVPILQIESLGETAEDIVKEAYRLLDLGLDKSKTVFKIPASLEATRACKMLADKGVMVNIHLVYTIQQAYMAAAAGATYICILVGRMQDQGYNALELIEQLVNMVNRYGYKSKIMFSSVRNPQHVRDSIMLGCHTCTVPWKILKTLTDNNFTAIGTEQFVTHTRQLTMKVKDVIRPYNPIVHVDNLVIDAIMQMTESGLGAVSIVNDKNNLLGVFTDGDLRRILKAEGQTFLQKRMDEVTYNKQPIIIDSDASLISTVNIFKDKKVDNIIVVEDGCPVGIIDIQDLVKLNLIG